MRLRHVEKVSTGWCSVRTRPRSPTGNGASGGRRRRQAVAARGCYRNKRPAGFQTTNSSLVTARRSGGCRMLGRGDGINIRSPCRPSRIKSMRWCRSALDQPDARRGARHQQRGQGTPATNQGRIHRSVRSRRSGQLLSDRAGTERQRQLSQLAVPRHTPATSATASSAKTTHTTPTSPTRAIRHSAMPISMSVCRRIRAARGRYADQGDNSARWSHGALESTSRPARTPLP